jgi:hypothetical protein
MVASRVIPYKRSSSSCDIMRGTLQRPVRLAWEEHTVWLYLGLVHQGQAYTVSTHSLPQRQCLPTGWGLCMSSVC